jgi:hypothetical protein
MLRHVLYQWRFTCVKDCQAFSANSPAFSRKLLKKKTHISEQKTATGGNPGAVI